MYALFAAPAQNDRSPRYMEKAFAAIYQALRPGQRLTLYYTVHGEHLALACRFPRSLRESILGPLSANYPKAQVEMAEEFDADEAGCAVWYADVRLAPDLLPILRHSQFEDQLLRAYADPIDSLLRALRPDVQVRCRLVMTVTPAFHATCHHAKHAVERLGREFFERHKRVAKWFLRHVTTRRWRPAVWLLSHMAARTPEVDRTSLDTSTAYRHEREADLQAAADKCGGHLFVVQMRLIAVATSEQAVIARERLHAIAGALGAFTRSRLATFTTSPIRRWTKLRRAGPGFLLSHEELATLWHPPTVGVTAERMQVASFSELEAPALLPSGTAAGEVVVGKVQHRDDRRVFGLARDDRRRHVHIVGRTGVGKTTLLLNQITSDMAAGHGVGLIDPHGDLADTVL